MDDDDLVANVQKLYGVTLSNLKIEQEADSTTGSPHLLRNVTSGTRSASVCQDAIQETCDKEFFREQFIECRRPLSGTDELDGPFDAHHRERLKQALAQSWKDLFLAD